MVNATGCSEFIQEETARKMGIGMEKMNGFSFRFRLLAGRERSISRLAFTTKRNMFFQRSSSLVCRGLPAASYPHVPAVYRAVKDKTVKLSLCLIS
jgi:hypothetical protein